MKRQRGLTLIDTLVALVLLALVVGVLPPLMRGVRSPAGMYVSLNNVRQIVRAMHQYRADTGGQMPMRGTKYSVGKLSGWDSWHYAGKNCDSYGSGIITWAGSEYDESAYARPLNQYLTGATIPIPSGYRNTGSGPTWTFSHGNPTYAERNALQVPICQSPGDTVSYMGSKTGRYSFPDRNGFTCYDSLGTSYQLNMAWWDGVPQSNDFTLQFDTGVQAFRSALDGAPIRFTRPPGKPFVTPNLAKIAWIYDQHGDLIINRWAVSNTQLPSPLPGEFGGDNRTVSGFLDGHVAYIEFQNNTPNTGTYHLFPWLP